MRNDGFYNEEQISIIGKINNELEYGCLEVDDTSADVLFVVKFKPETKYSDLVEHYYVENIDRVINYGANFFDGKYGEIIDDMFII